MVLRLLEAEDKPQGLGPILDNPAKWVTDVFNDALVAFGQKTTRDMSGVLGALLGGSSNVINQTPPSLSYQNAVVVEG